VKVIRPVSFDIVAGQCLNLGTLRSVILHSHESPEGGLVPVTTTALAGPLEILLRFIEAVGAGRYPGETGQPPQPTTVIS